MRKTTPPKPKAQVGDQVMVRLDTVKAPFKAIVRSADCEGYNVRGLFYDFAGLVTPQEIVAVKSPLFMQDIFFAAALQLLESAGVETDVSIFPPEERHAERDILFCSLDPGVRVRLAAAEESFETHLALLHDMACITGLCATWRQLGNIIRAACDVVIDKP